MTAVLRSNMRLMAWTGTFATAAANVVLFVHTPNRWAFMLWLAVACVTGQLNCLAVLREPRSSPVLLWSCAMAALAFGSVPFVDTGNNVIAEIAVVSMVLACFAVSTFVYHPHRRLMWCFAAAYLLPAAVGLWAAGGALRESTLVLGPFALVLLAFGDFFSRDRDRLAQIEATAARTGALDPVTNTLGRRTFLRQLDDLARGGATGVLAYVDIDEFKKINDELGHAAGDQVLRAIAGRLSTQLNPALHGRIGGDELVAFVHNAESARDVGDLAARVFADPVRVGPTSRVVAGSIGLAAAGEAEWDSVSLLATADAAMYDAKATAGTGWSGEGSVGKLTRLESPETSQIAFDTSPVPQPDRRCGAVEP